MRAESHEDVAEGEILKADSKHQRLAILILALASSLGIWSLLRLERRLTAARAVSLESVSQAARQTLEAAVPYFQGLGLAMALFGLYLLVLACRIWLSGQFPPPGAWIVRDTRLRRGLRARFRSVVAGTMGVVLLAGGIFVPGWAEDQITHVLKGALQAPDEPPESYLPHIE